RSLDVAVLHLEAAMLHGQMETRGVQGNAAEVRSLHVQTRLTVQGSRCKPFALYVGLQIQIALQRRLVQQCRQVHVGQLQAAPIPPRRSPSIEFPVQVEVPTLTPELTMHS